MYDLTVINFYRYQDTKPAGIDNDCKYSLQKLEYKLYNFNWENLNVFRQMLPHTASLSELTTEIFLKLFNVLYRNIAFWKLQAGPQAALSKLKQDIKLQAYL